MSGCSSGTGKPVGEAEAALSVPELQERLKTRESATRLGAVHGLRRHGAEAAPAVAELTRLLKEDAELAIRQAAALALGDVGPRASAAVPELTRTVQKEIDAPLRRQAAVALGKIGAGARSALPVLRQLAQDGPPIVRRAAEEAIKEIQASAAAR